MKSSLSVVALVATLLLSGVSIDAVLAPAAAQDVSVDFDTFHDYLANYGDWVYSDRWGEVWIPDNVPDDFQPYMSDGYWVDTDEYGWYWQSNYAWGDVPFHYGRWVNDPDDGWLWIPGYVWSPAWVAWRSNGQYIGWMPMPPDPQFLGYNPGPSFGLSFGGGIGVSINFGDTSGYYGYSQWYGPSFGADNFASMWVFVSPGHMADRDFRRYQAPRANYTTIINNTTNITNYTVVNNYIVNRSVDPQVIVRAGGHPVTPVHFAAVVKNPRFVTRADAGRQMQERMRTQMPRGTGVPNSAPKPSQKVVQSLSPNVKPHGGHQPMHLYTRDTVKTAPLPAKAGGPAPVGGPGTTRPMSGPMNGGPMGHETKTPPSGSMMGPSHTPGTTPETHHEETHHETGTMSGPGGGMSGPSGGSPETHHHVTTGPGASGGMNAPKEETHHHETPSGGGMAPANKPIEHIEQKAPPPNNKDNKPKKPDEGPH